MSADDDFFLSLLNGFTDLEAEVSHIRADVDAQISSQSGSTQSKRGRGRRRESHKPRPWEQIQSRLDGVDKAIERMVKDITARNQSRHQVEHTPKPSGVSQQREEDVPMTDIEPPVAPAAPAHTNHDGTVPLEDDASQERDMGPTPNDSTSPMNGITATTPAAVPGTTEQTQPPATNTSPNRQAEPSPGHNDMPAQDSNPAETSDNENLSPTQPAAVPDSESSRPQPSAVHTPARGVDDRPAAVNQSPQPLITPDADSRVEGRFRTTSSSNRDTTESLSPVGTCFTSPDRSSPASPATTISADDMRERLVPKLADLQRCSAAQKMTVPVIDVPLAEMQDCININDDSWQYTSIMYQPGPKGKGYVKIHISHDKPALDWSVFSTEVERPTKTEAKRIFENTIQSPPAGNIPYITGHAKLPSIRPLDPGTRIKELAAMEDLQSHYDHIGVGLSGNRIHCENMTYSIGSDYYGLRSYNEVYAGSGYKLWLVIAEHHISKFDDFFASSFRCSKCNQRVGHQSILIAPSRLDQEGIDYEIEVIGCGEAFRTLPGQQHQIINYGACAARSINYLHADDTFDPKHVDYCCKCGVAQACAKYGATLVPAAPVLSKTAKRPRSRHAQTSRVTRACTEVLQRLDQDTIKAHNVDPLCHIPQVDRSDISPTQVDVFLRATSVRSKVAVDQLCALTHELLRQRQSEAQNLTSSTSSTSSTREVDFIDKQILYLRGKVRESVLACYMVRHAQVCLALAVDKEKEGSGRGRASTEDIQRRAERLGMKNINYHLQEGRNWVRVCGSLHGLLPLILLGSKVLGNKLVGSKDGFGVNNKCWFTLRDDFLDAFHQLLGDEFSLRLLAAGKLFEGLLDGSCEATSKWEEVLCDVVDARDLDSCLTSYMQLTK